MVFMRAILLTVGILLGLPAAAFPAGTLGVVTDEWPPYVYVENGVVKGADYEIMMAVLDGMGYDADVNIYPWKRCLSMIKSRKADAILDIGMTEDRKKQMIFPDENISSSVSVLFCLADADFAFSRLEDLNGLRIGTILGYVYSKQISEADFFEKLPVQTLRQNVDMLLLGRIDMFIANRNAGLFTAKKMKVLDRVKTLEKPISGGLLYLAFSRKKDHVKLAKKFSIHLERFKQTGAYEKILIRYGQL